MTAWAITINKPLPYDAGVRLQTELVAARIADTIPDIVLFLEHTSVITLGVRTRDGHVLLPATAAFGGNGYVAVPADFDGDGAADLAIYETATSIWIFRLSTMGYAPLTVVF